jgi:hypothetical protein
MAEVIGEYIDRIATVEMRSKTPPRGVIHRLYEAARKKSGQPLTMAAASKLIDVLKENDNCLIVTGAGAWPVLPKGETDGPLGAASLARAIDIGIGAKPLFISDEHNLPPIIATCEAAGLTITDVDDRTFEARPHSGMAFSCPLDPKAALSTAKELLDKYKPKAVISIERLGPNEKGYFHTVRGFRREDCAHLNLLVDEARKRSIPTIGIGDNGNEIGCGLIHEDVKEIQTYGSKCRCPCQAGMATVAITDYLIIASTSNWGAYGVSACMAYLLDDLEVIQDPYVEQRMLEQCVDAGGVDGELGTQTYSVDGISPEVQQAVVVMMREVVRRGLRKLRKEVTYPQPKDSK